MIVLGRPWCFWTLCKKRLARSSEEHVDLHGTMWRSLVMQSTTIQMASYPWLSDNPTTKSMLRSCHGASGTGFGFRMPNGDCQDAFCKVFPSAVQDVAGASGLGM